MLHLEILYISTSSSTDIIIMVLNFDQTKTLTKLQRKSFYYIELVVSVIQCSSFMKKNGYPF